MSTKIEKEPKSNSYKGAFIGAGIALLLAGGYIKATESDAPSKKPAVEASATSATPTSSTIAERVEGTPKVESDIIARDIEDTLNSGKEFVGSVVKVGHFFQVKPEFQQETGIQTIDNPLQLTTDTFSYIITDQESGKVQVKQIDAELGELIAHEEGESPYYNFENKDNAGFRVTSNTNQPGFVVVLDNEMLILVGQAISTPTTQG